MVIESEFNLVKLKRGTDTFWYILEIFLTILSTIRTLSNQNVTIIIESLVIKFSIADIHKILLYVICFMYIALLLVAMIVWKNKNCPKRLRQNFVQ